jgi:hypothetical protein
LECGELFIHPAQSARQIAGQIDHQNAMLPRKHLIQPEERSRIQPEDRAISHRLHRRGASQRFKDAHLAEKIHWSQSCQFHLGWSAEALAEARPAGGDEEHLVGGFPLRNDLPAIIAMSARRVIPYWLCDCPSRMFSAFFCKNCESLSPPPVMNSILSTDPSIEVLQRFLGIFDVAAVAHAREELSAEQKATIAAFARGEMSESERHELIPLLAHNTTALEYLAELLKGNATLSENP